ncbi:MAG: hypothetical protein Q9204_006208, partial [Flavoplaca sp. TL-2023a]
MPSQRIVQDSDEEENADTSPLRLGISAPEIPSSPAGTGSTGAYLERLDVNGSYSATANNIVSPEKLSRDIQNAYISLLEPSTSSRSPMPSSDSTSSSKKRATIAVEEERTLKKPRITYGGRRSQEDEAVTLDSDDEGPVLPRRQSRKSLNTVPFKGNRCQTEDGEHAVFSNTETSMAPPVPRSSGVSQQDLQSSFPSTIPIPERPSSPVRVHPITRKRARSESESPRIILGDEIAPSSSAPASSPIKRARTASMRRDDSLSQPQDDVDGGYDELSLSTRISPINCKNQTQPIARIPSSKVHESDEPDTAYLVPDIPAENYQPRPSRSRSALAVDDVVIPTDFSKRPESLVKKKTKSKRQKAGIHEEPDPSAKASPTRRQAIPAETPDPTRMKKLPKDTSVEECQNIGGQVVLETQAELETDVTSPVKSSPKTLPPKKSRGRPKKATTTEDREHPAISVSIPVDDGTAQETSNVPTSASAPGPAKRGRKKKRPLSDELSSAIVHEDPPSADEHKEPPAVAKKVLNEADPNVLPLPTERATSVPQESETTDPVSETLLMLEKTTNLSGSPNKQTTVKPEEKK